MTTLRILGSLSLIEKHLGYVDPATISKFANSEESPGSRKPSLPHISLCMSLDDMEQAAEKVLSPRAFSYFHSAADSLASLQKNVADWKKITFRPRVLRNVARVSMQRTIMGQRSNLPFFIAPAAMGILAHEDAELGLTRGAARKNIPFCVSTYSSVHRQDIAACLKTEASGGCLFFQLFVPEPSLGARNLIAEARKLGFKALVVTVDTPVVGRREEDERYKAQVAYVTGETVPILTMADQNPSGQPPVLRGVHSSTLDWNDLVWIRETWAATGPIILKGIQTAEDAKKAYTLGIDGIYLSNHGGRQIDHGPSSIRTLLEIRKFCPELLGRIDIYLDGGIKRGSDVVKALCLGATAVSLARPFMYALGAYGTDGVIKAIESECPFDCSVV